MARQAQQAGFTYASLPDRLPLAGNTMYRSSARTKDARYLNCFQESLKSELNDKKVSFVSKRPGLSTIITVATGEARGFHHWTNSITSQYYSVIADKLYANSVVIESLGTSTGKCGFEEFDNGGIRYLFMCDGINGYVIDSGDAVTRVDPVFSTWLGSHNYALGDQIVPTSSNGYYYEVTTDAGSSSATQPTWTTTIGNTNTDGGITWTCMGETGGFPSPHIPTPTFVDGYMLLPRSGSADVHNSDVDNIYGWGAANFYTAEMFPDNVLALARQNNQIVTFGTNTTEFFYDGGLTGGSPFARNEGALIQTGIACPYAIYQNERFCIFVGQSDSGGRAIWLIEGFQPKKISTEFIERSLDAETLSTCYGFGLRTKGHLFFVLNLTNSSFVYDVEEKVWHEWTSNSSGTHTAFQYSFATDPGSGKAALLHKTTGVVATLDPLVYQDSGTSILMEIFTPKYDGGTMNRKSMHNLNVVGDEQTAQTIDIRWSDDDYTTWSTWHTLSIASRSILYRLGMFRRRAFNMLFIGNTDCRLEALEFEVDIGTH
jgi:hypothetical protein